MASYRIDFAPAAVRDLRKLDRATADRIERAIESLSSSPRPRQSRKLAKEEGKYRLRVGDYRVIYEIFDSERIVDISAIRHRREAYR
jgi:mRNA interferase RelE/StbE